MPTVPAVPTVPASSRSSRRPLSLRTRLAGGIAVLVLVMSVLIGAASTVSLRHSLMGRLDSQLVAAADRAQVRRHQDTGAPPAAPDQPSASGTATPARPASPSSPASSSATETTSEAAAQEDSQEAGQEEESQPTPHRLPPGLDAAGQATGTLALVAPHASTASDQTEGAEATVMAAYIDSSGAYRELTAAQTSALLGLPDTGEPVSITLEGLGDYRVLLSQDTTSGDVVVTGLSLAGTQALVRRQLLIEAGIALAGAGLAAWFGRVLVRRRLAPLERVAATARRVAAQPLARGEVSISQRVSEADLASSSEVGEVGRALNTLLAHVDDALTVRQRSEAQMRQFVADASHELRTPLASVRGYTELLQRRLADSPTGTGHGPGSEVGSEVGTDTGTEVTRALDRVHSESVRMTGLVEDLLLLARLDAGRELHRQEVDLLALAADAVTDAQVSRPDHTWELDLSGLMPPETEGAEDPADGGAHGPAEDEGTDGPGLPVVQGDEARLRQVLANLLTNAAVHTPAGTHVTVRLRHEDGPQPAWVTEVSDDGPGIPPGLRERVFERFARGDESRERAGAPGEAPSSTGLGTSIALAIVRSHGGTLTVTSTTGEELAASGTSDEAAPSTGTTFTVRLPAAG